MDSLLQDLRYALRTLRRSPAFTVVAVLSLGLGIFAITAVFSLINAFFLRPLPFEEPERLVHVWGTDERQQIDTLRVSVPNFRDWRGVEAFESLGGYFYTTFTLTGNDGEANTQVQATMATPSLFETLGVEPAIGRTLAGGDAEPGAERVALISDRFWERHFAREPGALGRTLLLDDRPARIVGVMPRSFVFPFNSMELWLPLDVEPYADDRGSAGPLLVVARLAEGVTVQQAQSELDTVGRQLEQAYPEDNEGRGGAIVDLRSQLLFTWDTFSIVFPALLLAIGFVLLIVCANLGNLMLARTTRRSRELAFRQTLGATRARLIRQLLTEAIAIAIAGAVVGTVLAYLIASGFETAMPGELYRVGEISVDLPALLFALAVACGCVLLFGLAPALQTTRTDLVPALAEGGRGASAGRAAGRLRNGLVLAQVALAVLLVAGASLMVRTFMQLQRVDLGFTTEQLLTLEVTLPTSKYPEDPEEIAYFNQGIDEISAVPGVRSVGSIYPLPLNHEQLGGAIEVAGYSPAEGEVPGADRFWVSPGALATLGVPIVQGRGFETSDDADAAPVALVNQTLAGRYFSDRDPVGSQIKSGDTWRTIVGVADDFRAFDLTEQASAMVFFPQDQLSTRRRFVLVRTEGEPDTLRRSVEEALASVDPAQPITNVRSMRDVVATWLAPWMMGIGGLSGLGIGALLLASMGLFGVISYTVSQRHHELGIRRAIGASGRDVVLAVMREGLLVTGSGVLVGLVGSAILTRFLESLLYGVGSLDLGTFVVTPLILVTVALLACYLPARRAARIDPMVALRHD
ncbi:MAG TPA: ABC transporter permease [Thermoanaerobaculia bacterium]|nr:ABC transporter permease [Thermoanaerobaculia bacterium]